MTIMLKKGKKALLDDLRSKISSEGYSALSSAISTCGLSEYSDKIPIVVHRGYNGDSRPIDLIHLLRDYNSKFSENIALAILSVLDDHLYTQEEMEKDIGLDK